MAFFLTILFIVLAYLSPVEMVPALAPFRPILILSLVGMVATVLTIPLARFRFNSPQILLLLCFTAMIGFSVIVAQRWLGGAVSALESFMTPVFAFFMVAISSYSVTRVRILAFAMIFVCLFLAFQGMAALNYGYGGTKFIYYDWHIDAETGMKEHSLARIRGAGFLNDPNDLAQNFLVGLSFLVMFWKKRAPFFNIFFILVPASLILYGMWLTHSRGGLLGLVIMLALLLKDHLGRMGSGIMAGGLLTGLLAMNFAGGRGISMAAGEGRLEAWSMGIQMLKDSPIWGVGYGGFMANHNQTAHNSFVLCFAEVGLVGYFFWLGLIVCTVMELGTITRVDDAGDPETVLIKRWAAAVRLALYTFLATCWFLSRTYMPTLYILIAMAVALAQVARRKNLPIVEASELPWAPRTMILQVATVLLIYATLRVRG